MIKVEAEIMYIDTYNFLSTHIHITSFCQRKISISFEIFYFIEHSRFDMHKQIQRFKDLK